jgi:hypothetical protein
MGWYGLLARSIVLLNAPQPYSPLHKELQEKFCGPWAVESYLAQRLELAGLQSVETARQKEIVRAGTPDVFIASMQFPLRLVVNTWWQGERNGILGELNGAMKGIIEREFIEDGEVVTEFDGVVGWGCKSG